MELVRHGRVFDRLRSRIGDSREQLAELGATAYGLDASWAGPRYVAEWHHTQGGGSGEVVDEQVSVELGHGQHKTHRPNLLVETVRRRGSGDLSNVHRWGADHLREGPSRPLELLVDGTAVTAEYWRGTNVQIASFERDGVTVTVRARSWPDLAGTRLTRVADLEPYWNGREVLLFRRDR